MDRHRIGFLAVYGSNLSWEHSRKTRLEEIMPQMPTTPRYDITGKGKSRISSKSRPGMVQNLAPWVPLRPLEPQGPLWFLALPHNGGSSNGRSMASSSKGSSSNGGSSIGGSSRTYGVGRSYGVGNKYGVGRDKAAAQP